jgi:hypothetical protein
MRFGINNLKTRNNDNFNSSICLNDNRCSLRLNSKGRQKNKWEIVVLWAKWRLDALLFVVLSCSLCYNNCSMFNVL